MNSTDRLSPDDLRIFVRVARLASFTRAAEQLELPRATVSTALSRLEARLDARLLQRTTRRVTLTAEGEALLARAEDVLGELEALATLFRAKGQALEGRLRVDMPLGMSAGAVMTRLPEFLAAHPGLRVEVCSTDRRVDLIADGFDCVVRAGAVVDESLACRPLGALPLVNVASISYVQQHGMPQSLDDLRSHWLVGYQPNPGDHPAGFEHRDERAKRTLEVPMRHWVTVNNSAAYEAACRAGLGIAQLPASTAARGIADGVLLDLLPAYRPPPMPLNLLYAHRRHLPRRVKVFADWLAQVLAGTVVLNRP